MTYWEVRTAKAEQQAREKVGRGAPRHVGSGLAFSFCLSFLRLRFRLRLRLQLRLVQDGVLCAVC